MEKRFGVVSADGHCRLMHLPFDLWTKRLPSKLQDDGPKVVKGPDGTRLGSVDTDLETWNHVFRVNFFAPIMMARGLINELKAVKGSVVNVTSIAGSRVHPFAGAAYATSKAALAALTREMASDFGRVGVSAS